MVVVYPQVAVPLELEDKEEREGVMMNAPESKIESKGGEENKWNTVCMRSDRVVKPQVLYMNEYGSDGVEGALINYCAHMCLLDEDETKNIEIAA